SEGGGEADVDVRLRHADHAGGAAERLGVDPERLGLGGGLVGEGGDAGGIEDGHGPGAGGRPRGLVLPPPAAPPAHPRAPPPAPRLSVLPPPAGATRSSRRPRGPWPLGPSGGRPPSPMTFLSPGWAGGFPAPPRAPPPIAATATAARATLHRVRVTLNERTAL